MCLCAHIFHMYPGGIRLASYVYCTAVHARCEYIIITVDDDDDNNNATLLSVHRPRFVAYHVRGVEKRPFNRGFSPRIIHAVCALSVRRIPNEPF